MEIRNLRHDFFPGKTANPPENLNSKKRANSFDAFLSAAGERQQSFLTANERVESPGIDENTVRQETAPKEEYTDNDATPVYEEVQIYHETYTPTEEEALVYKAAFLYIADSLDLPVDELAQWLTDESIELYELDGPKNLPKFALYVLGETEPAEILTDPKLPLVYKVLKETMEILKEPKKVLVPNEQVLAGSESESGKTPIVRAEINNVVVIEEDGEVVVSENKTPENIETRGSRQPEGMAQTPERAQNPETPELPPPAQPASNEAAAPLSAGQNNQQTVELPPTQGNTPQTGTPVNAQDVINQIMTQVKVSYTGQNFTEMRMTLRPESLGEIVLRVMTQNGIVMAQFEAESQRVKEALEANFNLLRNALTEAGVAFGELNVYVRQEGDNRMGYFERERQAARRRMEEIQVEEVPDTRDLLHTGILDEVA